MWKTLKNIGCSLSTYEALSPDLQLRQVVNRRLQQRPGRSLPQWIEEFWLPRGISAPVADFVSRQLGEYSGLETTRLLPSDHLETTLHLTLVCWFDWSMRLCEDFYQEFGIDISHRLDFQDLSTLEELLVFLNAQLLQAQSSPPP
ncbi:hypothetical protein DO97_12515 [Neosynechococcus sphagnicola sy1]|uniref:Carrier domain-containing protein n=1 Tax=Neosynechococcus sphagnicola sy1 TaxID=1497020 RepID=A0A098TMM0_9CYAN|nr:hypothetical protein [Neosynechococcus sphagnicola]KGF72078.1 hypothetical protein DO97_12515 [Neosynechococcus sphagnicola sy1]